MIAPALVCTLYAHHRLFTASDTPYTRPIPAPCTSNAPLLIFTRPTAPACDHTLEHLACAFGTYLCSAGRCLQVADPAADVHQKVLMVLGNLVSDAVDPQVST